MCNAHVWSPIRMSKLPGFYDKAHLFDVEIPGEEDQTERVWLHRERWIDCFPCWVTRRPYRFGNRKNLNVNWFPRNTIQIWVMSSNSFFTVLRCESSLIQLVASSNGCRHHHISICFYRDHWSGSLGIPFESSSHRNAMFCRRRSSDGHS